MQLYTLNEVDNVKHEERHSQSIAAAVASPTAVCMGLTFLLICLKFACVFQCVAFPDIAPQAPTHILVVPKKQIVRPSEVKESDAAVSVIKNFYN